MKFCINCRHFEADPDPELGTCAEVKRQTTKVAESAVTGKSTIGPQVTFAQVARNNSILCGPDAKWFELQAFPSLVENVRL